MIFELMSNGTLAKLPPKFIPDGILDLEAETNPFVLLLLPHNRYILGRVTETDDEHWVMGKPGGVAKDIFLYDNEKLKLFDSHNENRRDFVSLASNPPELSAEVVTFLKRELLRQMEPPGDHKGTMLLLRSLLKGIELKSQTVIDDDFIFQDEASFMQVLDGDEILRKIYWTLRFAMTRSETEVIARLKAWLKAGPEIFEESEHTVSDEEHPGQKMKIWFSIMDLPDDAVIKELETLAFSREDLSHMVMQQVSPLLLFNPRSGYLVLLKLAQRQDEYGKTVAGFHVWAYVPPNFWTELRERRKMTVREIMMALWGQHDIDQAMEIRSHYAHSLPVASVDSGCSETAR